MLFHSRKNNLDYLLSRCFQAPEDDASGSRLPFDRMPFSLVDYNIDFFVTDNMPTSNTNGCVFDNMMKMRAHTFKKSGCIGNGLAS